MTVRPTTTVVVATSTAVAALLLWCVATATATVASTSYHAIVRSHVLQYSSPSSSCTTPRPPSYCYHHRPATPPGRPVYYCQSAVQWSAVVAQPVCYSTTLLVLHCPEGSSPEMRAATKENILLGIIFCHFALAVSNICIVLVSFIKVTNTKYSLSTTT